jgi:hypothetical protein
LATKRIDLPRNFANPRQTAANPRMIELPMPPLFVRVFFFAITA